jgi:predicted homoserine dehydrogenase-like protein
LAATRGLIFDEHAKQGIRMIIVDKALERRQAEGRPLRVGMIGTGFMGSGIVLQTATAIPGMEIVAIAARRPQQAQAAFEQAGQGDQTVRCDTVGQVEAAIAAGKRAITEDPAAVGGADGVDAIIEVTGAMDFPLRGILPAIESGKHVVMMNPELDGTVGPILKRKADKAGVVISNADGDQPGVEMNLFRFVKGLGVRPVLCGNIKGLQDPYRTPTTQRGFADKWGQNVHMVTSFADGTKVAYEQAVVANATGMRVAKRGMIGPDPTNMDPTQPLRNLEEYVSMFAPYLDKDREEGGAGIVDFVVGARPGPGIFVLGTHDHPRQQHYLNLYKLGAGPYYLFYTPYHLCHFEVPYTVARAALFGDATIAPLGAPQVSVGLQAKKDLAAGEILDGIGGYTTYGIAENYPVFARERLLPMGLSEGCKLKRAIPKDDVITMADVEIPQGRLIDKLYAELEAAFPVVKAAA